MSEAELRERVDILEAENDYLKRLLGRDADEAFIEAARTTLGIPPACCRMLWALVSGKSGKKEALLRACVKNMYDEPDIQVVDVHMCRLRKVLRPHGVTIDTIWGFGFRMTPESCAKVKALLGWDGTE
ncbi:helix-turn-helix domain-containing protein [Devosia algicola]|uniref:Helix-turn-helix domain-containing protein n=1 Tax=Devosia algicola TaxID=3026418 RepID=A0ABY7YR89_9HYPH|nr:helix-turn-helix domain-containing protein [Devosia algicola]WDR03643.1 helix-turn-helix domain-containing protein [Devosia algicola]